jgi:hypothetical protein
MESRIIYVFDQVVNLLDRMLGMVATFRDELLDLHGRELTLGRLMSDNNSILLNLLLDLLSLRDIINTLPDRLGERFGSEINKALSKHFGDKKK